MRIITKTILAASFALLPLAGAQAMDKPPHGGGHGGGSGGHSGSPTSVPEPGVLGLFALGLGGLVVGRRLAKRRSDD